MLQWTPGPGNEETWHRRWWPMYHKSIEAGKKLIITCDTVENLKALKNEFGAKLKQFMISMGAKTPAGADEILKLVEV